MAERINNGPDDDPDEYWFKCDDCKGTGTVTIQLQAHEVEDWDDVDEAQGFRSAEATCERCDGLGFWQGTAADEG